MQGNWDSLLGFGLSLLINLRMWELNLSQQLEVKGKWVRWEHPWLCFETPNLTRSHSLFVFNKCTPKLITLFLIKSSSWHYWGWDLISAGDWQTANNSSFSLQLWETSGSGMKGTFGSGKSSAAGKKPGWKATTWAVAWLEKNLWTRCRWVSSTWCLQIRLCRLPEQGDCWEMGEESSAVRKGGESQGWGFSSYAVAHCHQISD